VRDCSRRPSLAFAGTLRRQDIDSSPAVSFATSTGVAVPPSSSASSTAGSPTPTCGETWSIAPASAIAASASTYPSVRTSSP